MAASGADKGRRDGFALGLNHGYFHGRCAAVMAKYAQEAPLTRNYRILYVRSGKGYPYSPLDRAIIDSLSEMTEQLATAFPKDDVVGLAAAFKPDAAIVLDAIGSFPPEKADALRRLGIKTAVWFTDDPYYTDVTISLAPHYDYVFTMEQSCVPLYRSIGCGEVHHLPFAVNPRVYHPRKVDLSLRSDVCFIGSAFWNRVQFFDRLAPYLAGKKTLIVGLWWNRLRHYRLLKSKIRLGQWMNPEQTSARYFGAKIVINMHRSHEDESFNRNSRKIPALSVNPRTFEICGSGAFQLTDVRQDLERMYTPGREVAVYDSAEHLIRQLEYYLNHDEEREAIAVRGLERTLREHTYRHRLAAIFKVMFGEPS